jgi:hypothetical protein
MVAVFLHRKSPSIKVAIEEAVHYPCSPFRDGGKDQQADGHGRITSARNLLWAMGIAS